VHGLAITAGQTLTVTTGGTLGSAAYTASTAYAAALGIDDNYVTDAQLAALTSSFADIVIDDGGTIKTATGPIITFDETNGFIEIEGCQVGGGTVPSQAWDVNGKIKASGASAGLQLVDRTATQNLWEWYVNGGLLKLYSSLLTEQTTIMEISATGISLPSTTNSATFVPLAAPLSSAAWDGGDDFSTVSTKTKIDLSDVFGAPAGIKAVLVCVAIRDSGSLGTDCYLVLSPNDDATGLACNTPEINSRWNRDTMTVPCDPNGDIYYQIGASGTNTFRASIQIWGYWI
jgi:hypothetical protein